LEASSFRSELFRSRVARRLLALFVLCALLPTLGLGAVAFGQVRQQLERESRDRLHGASKAVGLAIHERLLFLETALQSLATRLAALPRKSWGLSAQVAVHLGERFSALSVVEPEGRIRALLGEGLAAPELTPDQQAHLRRGGTVVVSAGREGDLPRVLLVHRIGVGRLVAEVAPGYLFRPALDATDGDGREFCVLDDRSRPLACSSVAASSRPPEPSRGSERGASGDLEWSPGGEPHLARWWVLFLKARFASPGWTVVMAESQHLALAALDRFTRSFIAIGTLSLLIVVGLSLVQIRRSLIPLRQLLAGTGRVGRQDFDNPVEVRSGDEFEELARSFNAMASRLAQQFRALEARSELDRAILSAMHLQTILDTVLERVPHLHPCDAVAVIVLDAASGTTGRCHLAAADAPGRRRRDEVVLPLEVVHALESGSEVAIDLGGAGPGTPGYLKPLEHGGMRSTLVLPIRTGRQLVGALCLGWRTPGGASWDERSAIRQLADQVAVAFANAQMIERIRFLAYHDPLTRLPNRRRFTEDLEKALGRARRLGTSVAVIFFDLDEFKRVNDTLGHGVGDSLLRAVSYRIRERVCRRPGRSEYELARLGGDEFTLLATDLESMEEATAIADRVLEALGDAFHLGSHEVFVSGSVGIAMYPLDGDEAGVLMRNADTAMHAAKEMGKSRFQFYTRSMNEAAMERVTLEGQLRHGLEREQFELHYQPIIDLRTGRLSGAEALLRWRHPELGLVRPDVFIRIAEETGLIVPLGAWVLRTACRAACAWQERAAGPVAVSVNLSGRQFREEKLGDVVARALAESGLHPNLLWLEITESMLMRGDAETVDTLRGIRTLGARIAIDDFGTGYSSLAYLKHFPVDRLKIDRSFVDDVAGASGDAAITRAVIAMGHSLQLEVVAEGVETQEQLDFLRRHRCDAIQGFLIAKPMPLAEFQRFFLDGSLG